MQLNVQYKILVKLTVGTQVLTKICVSKRDVVGVNLKHPEPLGALTKPLLVHVIVLTLQRATLASRLIIIIQCTAYL